MKRTQLTRLCAKPWVAAIFLCALTVAGLQSGLRYQSVPSGPFAGRDLEVRPSTWDRTPSGVGFVAEQGRATARLSAVRDGWIAGLRTRLALPAGLDALGIELEMRAMALAPGEEGWETGQVQVLGYDSDGRSLWYWPRDVASLSGDTDWRPVQAIIPTGPALATADLIIYNGARSGELGVRSVRVTGLVERPSFGAIRYGLLAAWGLVGLWVVILLIRRSARTVGAAALVVCASLALAAALTPQPTFRQVSGPIEDSARLLLDAIFDYPVSAPMGSAHDAREDSGSGAEDLQMEGQAGEAAASRPGESSGTRGLPVAMPAGRDYPFNFKEAGHFFVFLLLGLTAFFAFPGVPVARLLGYLLLFAVATETLQLFVITRSGTMKDLAVDAAGALCAIGLPIVARLITALVRAWSRRLFRSAAPP